jgi:proline racemase
MAQLHTRGELRLGQDFVSEPFIGTRFTGRLVSETMR